LKGASNTYQHANESDHNISLYEDANGSMLDDMIDAGGGQTVLDGAVGGFTYDNAEDKLR